MIPPLPVERADSRPVRIVPLRDRLVWARFTAVMVGTLAAVTVAVAGWGLVVVNG